MTPNDSSPPGLYITGLGSQYPPYLLEPERLEEFAALFYDVERPGLQKLLQINRSSGIETRSAIHTYETGFATQSTPPSVSELDHLYRQAGVDLTTQACEKALRESHTPPCKITHTIAVTCTNHGNPGYDLLVNVKLGLPAGVDRMLLHGVGCAGGLSIMRAAAQIACGGTARGKPVRILAFACELCTPNIRHELAAVEQAADAGGISVAGALFSDAAAAFVLCNECAVLKDDAKPLFELLEWGNSLIPDTVEHMSFYADGGGYRTVLTREIPQYVKQAICPMFASLLPSYQRLLQSGPDAGEAHLGEQLGISDFDWALHPGGRAIIEGTKQLLGLSEDQLQASREIYRTRGNSSSASVLIVLDRLRSLGKREHVVATSFGPGLSIEMAMLRRCEVQKDRVCDQGLL